MNDKQASLIVATTFMANLFLIFIAADLTLIREQITEIRSHPQTYCIKYKPLGE